MSCVHCDHQGRSAEERIAELEATLDRVLEDKHRLRAALRAAQGVLGDQIRSMHKTDAAADEITKALSDG